MEVRRGTTADLEDVQELLRHSWQVHLQIPMEDLEKWALDGPFFVALLGRCLYGVILAIERQPEISMIGAAALDDDWTLKPFLDLVLPRLTAELRARGVDALVHMGYTPWFGEVLLDYGFTLCEQVITLEKTDRVLPPGQDWEGHIRQARRQDLPTLVEIDRAAFVPMWRNSLRSLTNTLLQVSSFTVAEVGGRIAGYQFSHRDEWQGHVSRLAVHPDFQHLGVGATLLTTAIRELWSQGATIISLNTQHDNYVSQKLYRRFGFEPTGESVPIFWLSLNQDRP